MLGLSFFILFHFLHFSPVLTVERETFSADDLETSQRDFVTLGNKWHVYLLTVTYDIAKVITYEAPQSISELTKAIPRTIHDTYPCQTLIISEAEELLEYQHTDGNGMLYHSIDADSTLCGTVSSIFVIPLPKVVALMPGQTAPWRWKIKAHPEFKINLTFLYMHVAMASQCTTLQAMVTDSPHADQINMAEGLLGLYCPGFPTTSFYSSQNQIHILLRPSFQNLLRFYESRYAFENYANVSFEYQIHDNDFQVWTRFPDYQWKALVKWTLLGYKQNIGQSYWRMLYDFCPRTLETFKLDILYPINMTGHLDVHQTLTSFGSGRTSLYIFHIQAYLGDRLAVRNCQLRCIGAKTQVIFYDGPFVDFLMVDRLLARLHTLVCKQPLEFCNDSIISSIGDITLALMLSHNDSSFEGSILSLSFEQYVESMSNSSQAHTILLSHMQSKRTISVDMGGTFMYIVAVLSEKYVQMSLSELKYEGYFQGGCAMGGLFFTAELKRYTHSPYIGSICSRETAKHFLGTFNYNNASLGRRAFIVLKQYSQLSKLSVTFSLSITDCYGIFNFVPHYVDNIFYKEPTLVWRASKTYFYHGFNSYYRWANSEPTFHMRLHDGDCLRLNYFKLSQAHPKSEFAQEFEQEFYFHLYSIDLRTPSILTVAYRGSDQNLEHFEDCFADGIRLLMDERNDEPYVYLTSFPNIISQTAYNFKVRINLHCLWLGSSFHIKLKRERKFDEACFREIGGYMYDIMHPVIPQGLCGDVIVQLDSWTERRISLQRPTQLPICCFYDILVHFPDTVCADSVRIYQAARHEFEKFGYIVQTWTLTKRSQAYLTWRGMCRNMWDYDSQLESAILSCMDMIVDAHSLCDMSLQFRASLMSKNLAKTGSQVEIEDDSRILCLKSSCYIVPLESETLSWMDAQDMCRKSNSSLTSINTVEEWELMTRNGLVSGEYDNITLLPLAGVQMFYIGYHTRVSFFLATLIYTISGIFNVVRFC